MSISDDFKLIDDEVDKILNMSEKAVVKEYATVLETLRTTIRKLYDKYEVEGKLTLTEMSKYERLLQMEKDVEESISKLYKENSSLMKGTLSNIFVLTTNETFDSLDKAVSGNAGVKSLIPLKKALSIDRTVNEKMAGLHWSERLGKYRIDVIYSINKTLKEGLAKGSTYKELSDRLKNELEGSVVQPMRIIRTEGGRVYAKAQEESLDKIASAGVKMTKTWKTSADERVRSKHRAMEGVTIPYEDEFVLPDGKRTKMPRLSGYAEHDIHCRCFVTIDVVEENIKAMDLKGNPNPNYKNSPKYVFSKYKDRQLYKMSIEADRIIKEYTKIPSKWSGRTVVSTMDNKTPSAKAWNCDIITSKRTSMQVLIHEHLHARSISYYGPEAYRKWRNIEESSVEFLATVIAKENGYFVIESGYHENVERLIRLNQKLKIYETEKEFAIKLFEITVDKRLDYLESQLNKATRNLTIMEVEKLYDELQSLYT